MPASRNFLPSSCLIKILYVFLWFSIFVACLPTTNFKWNDLGLNPGLHNERLAANSLTFRKAEAFQYVQCHTVVPNVAEYKEMNAELARLFGAVGMWR